MFHYSGVINNVKDDASSSMISVKLLRTKLLRLGYCSGQWQHFVSHLATPVHSELARESFNPSGRIPGLTELLCCILPEGFPGFEG